MEQLENGNKLLSFLKRHRYALIIVIVGIVLMLIPSGSETQTQTQTVQEQSPTYTDLTQQLSAILSQVEGAGRVEVMLTVATGETTVYQYDIDVTNGETGSTRQETVIITDSARGQSGLTQRIDPPRYQGAVIVCEGADSASVRLSIVEAVSKLTGLGTDRISVLKMK